MERSWCSLPFCVDFMSCSEELNPEYVDPFGRLLFGNSGQHCNAMGPRGAAESQGWSITAFLEALQLVSLPEWLCLVKNTSVKEVQSGLALHLSSEKEWVCTGGT